MHIYYTHDAPMRSPEKSTQLQVRVAPSAKARIARAARHAGMDLSAYVLARADPDAARRFEALTRATRDPDQVRGALAELNDLLGRLAADELREAVAIVPPGLTPFAANYVAAMVELACVRRGVPAPPWTHAIMPLVQPVFGSTLASLRLHLLARSPAAFRRRNIFIDSTLGDRV